MKSDILPLLFVNKDAKNLKRKSVVGYTLHRRRVASCSANAAYRISHSQLGSGPTKFTTIRQILPHAGAVSPVQGRRQAYSCTTQSSEQVLVPNARRHPRICRHKFSPTHSSKVRE